MADSSTSSALSAFKTTVGSDASFVGSILLMLFFALLLLCIAYILINVYDEYRKGGLSTSKLIWLVVRLVIMFSFLTYILLQ